MNSMDKATSKRALAQAGVRASGQALAREDEDGTRERILRTAERLIREHQVAVIPGSAFGLADGCYFRIAYGALQKMTVAEGIGRLVAGLRAILR